MKRTKAGLKIVSELLNTPIPWLCRRGFHSWSCWIYDELNVVQQNGKPFYTKLQQKRICLECKFDQRRNVND